MFHILGQLLVGLIIGAIARLFVSGEPIVAGPVGWLITALIGMGGSFVGTFLGRTLFGKENYGAGWVMSIVGAVILLLLFRWIF